MQTLAPIGGAWADTTTPWDFSPVESADNFADSHPPNSWANVATPWDAPSSTVRELSEVSASRRKRAEGSWTSVATPWGDRPISERVNNHFFIGDNLRSPAVKSWAV
jgi:hypothetical protein